ncbi:MAG TPA: hypothetical protein VH475_15735 [Tepidisphaeraceae bacterium]
MSELRRAAALTPDDVGRLIESSGVFVGLLERDAILPSERVVMLLSKHLDGDVDELLELRRDLLRSEGK